MSELSSKCVIIGGGPAGYTAAVYASRANLSPVLFEGMQPGGQLTTTTEVENFPGFPSGIQGGELVSEMRSQAEKFGARIVTDVVTSVDFSKRPFTLTVGDGSEVKADTVIIATGAAARYLGLPPATDSSTVRSVSRLSAEAIRPVRRLFTFRDWHLKYI